MYEDKYDEVIAKIKEVYPQLKDVEFDIADGELGYRDNSSIEVNIAELQLFVNEFLNQKVFRVTLTSYVMVYARNEHEAIEFAKRIKPNSFLYKPIETDEKRII